jgi:DNA-binding PadR family transcriptional regulator
MYAGFGWTENSWRWANGRAGNFDLRDFFGMFDPRRGGGGPRRGRMFDQGDLKLVVLRLLDEKPRHGYEIIKALEERSGGRYTPSPGAVYPTLQLLEELGYARAVDEGNGRKIYEITDEGRRHLAEHRSTAEDVFQRVSQAASAGTEVMHELGSAFASLGRSAFGAARKRDADGAKLRAIREILERADHDIQKLG